MTTLNFELPKNLTDFEAVIASSKHYLVLVKKQDLTLPAHMAQKATPTHRRPGLKKKGGHAPEDYSASELIVDFEAAIKRAEGVPSKENIRTLIILRLKLNRICPI